MEEAQLESHVSSLKEISVGIDNRKKSLENKIDQCAIREAHLSEQMKEASNTMEDLQSSEKRIRGRVADLRNGILAEDCEDIVKFQKIESDINTLVCQKKEARLQNSAKEGRIEKCRARIVALENEISRELSAIESSREKEKIFQEEKNALEARSAVLKVEIDQKRVEESEMRAHVVECEVSGGQESMTE